MIDKNELINVYNENDGKIFAISRTIPRGYIFDKGTVEDPFLNPISWDDILYINNRSDVFRTGTLRFDPEQEDEIYKALRIVPKQSNNYFTRKEVEDYILNPTFEKLQAITKITSIFTMEKFRHSLVVLDNEREYDISKRVYDVINFRYEELNKGKIKSEVVIRKTKNMPSSEEKKQEKINKEVEIKRNKEQDIGARKLRQSRVKKDTVKIAKK